MAALIDTGASQSFISPEMVRYLGLKKQVAPPKDVVLADGKTVTTNSIVTTEFLVEA